MQQWGGSCGSECRSQGILVCSHLCVVCMHATMIPGSYFHGECSQIPLLAMISVAVFAATRSDRNSRAVRLDALSRKASQKVPGWQTEAAANMLPRTHHHSAESSSESVSSPVRVQNNRVGPLQPQLTADASSKPTHSTLQAAPVSRAPNSLPLQQVAGRQPKRAKHTDPATSIRHSKATGPVPPAIFHSSTVSSLLKARLGTLSVSPTLIDDFRQAACALADKRLLSSPNKKPRLLPLPLRAQLCMSWVLQLCMRAHDCARTGS